MIEGSSSSDEGNNFVIAINRSFSDGTESSWPTEETCNKPVGDKRARVKLAKLWMQKTGEYQRGVFDRLSSSDSVLELLFAKIPVETLVRFTYQWHLATGSVGYLLRRHHMEISNNPISFLNRGNRGLEDRQKIGRNLPASPQP